MWLMKWWQHCTPRYLYLSLSQLVLVVYKKELLPRPSITVLRQVYNVVHFVLPVLLTLACYLSTIVAVSVTAVLC